MYCTVNIRLKKQEKMKQIKYLILLVVLHLCICGLHAQSSKEIEITFFNGSTRKGLITVSSKTNISKGIILNEINTNGDIVKFSPSDIQQVLFTRDSMIYQPILFKYKNIEGIEFEEIRLALLLYNGKSKLYRLNLTREDEYKMYGFSANSNNFIGSNKIVYILRHKDKYFYLRKIETIIDKKYSNRLHFKVQTKEEYKNYLNYIYRDSKEIQEKINNVNFSDYSLAHFIASTESNNQPKNNNANTNNITLEKREIKNTAYISTKYHQDKQRSVLGPFSIETGLGLEFFGIGSKKRISFNSKLGLGTFSPSKSNPPFYKSLTYKNNEMPIYARFSGGGTYYITRKTIEPYVSIEIGLVSSKITELTNLGFKYSLGSVYKKINIGLGAQFQIPYTSMYNNDENKNILVKPSTHFYNLFDITISYQINKN